MNLTFSKKTNISRKSSLWLFFLGILILVIALVAIGYTSLVSEPQESKIEEKPLKISEQELAKIEGFQYIGIPINLSSGIGKREPFK